MVQPLPAMSMYGPLLGYCYQGENPCSWWNREARVATSYGMKLAGVGTTRCLPRHMKRPTDKRAARIRYRSQRPKILGQKKTPDRFQSGVRTSYRMKLLGDTFLAFACQIVDCNIDQRLVSFGHLFECHA